MNPEQGPAGDSIALYRIISAINLIMSKSEKIPRTEEIENRYKVILRLTQGKLDLDNEYKNDEKIHQIKLLMGYTERVLKYALFNLTNLEQETIFSMSKAEILAIIDICNIDTSRFNFIEPTQ